MLAYPTARFDAKTILQGPSYRPLGRGSCNVYEPQPEAITPQCKVNRGTKNGGFVGNFSKNVPKDNQFMNKHYNPLDGTPLSHPGSVGNVGDLAISVRPTMAEPKNEELRLIMNILNGKANLKEHGTNLSAKMVESLGGKFKSEDVAVSFADDFTNTQRTMRREARIDNAIKQGFSTRTGSPGSINALPRIFNACWEPVVMSSLFSFTGRPFISRNPSSDSRREGRPGVGPY